MQIICGNCGQQIELDESAEAASIRCPSCSHEILLTDSHSNGIDENDGFASRARRLLSEAMQIECENCSLCLKVAKKMAGRRIRCPGCGYMINVPAEILDPEAFEEVKPATAESVLAAVAQANSTTAEQPAASSHHHKPYKKPGMGVMPWILLLVAAGLVAGIVYGIHVIKNKPAANLQNNPPDAENQLTLSQSVKPSDKMASVRILSCGWRMFANPAGYFPAEQGRCYARLELQITTGDTPVEFLFDDTDAFIESGGTRYYAIGMELNAASIIPADVNRTPLKINPHTNLSGLRLIFNLPAAEFRGRLEIKGCNDQFVSLSAPPQYSVNLPGQYIEHMPRNLKPMQHDPIIREFQLNYGLTLLASHSTGKVFAIKIPQAQISGTAELQPDRTFVLRLSHPRHGMLTCKAVLSEDGKMLFVFL
ncbi:MAG TPA: hypothetical protein PLK08_03970, partial [Phycisphaerae bacterium]|nr:hypothetical protein [Phycisphaerae bacterium]